MLAGLLNRKLTLQKKTVTNEYGEIVSSWENIKSKRASISNVAGGEVDKDGTINYNICNVILWYDKNISYNNRFIDSFNQIYNIQNIQILGQNEGLKIRCIVKENIKES